MKESIKNNSTVKLVLQSYNIIKRNFWSFLSFELIYKTLTLVIFIPLISVIFNKIIALSGFDNLTNSMLTRFIFSKYGFLSLIVLVPIAIILIFIEFSVLTIIAYYGDKNQKVTIISAFSKSVTYLPSLLGYGIVSMALYLILFLPLLNLGFGSSLIPGLQIPNFISGELMKSLPGTILYLLILIGIIYINIRWIFAIPIIVLEEKKTFKEAIKKSGKLVKHNYIHIIEVFLCNIAVAIILLAIIFFIVIGLFLLAVMILPATAKILETMDSLLYITIVSLAYIIAVAITPIYITLITKLYLSKISESDVKLKMDSFNFKNLKDNENKKFLKKYGASIFTFILMVGCSVYLILKSFGVEAHYGDIEVMAHRGVLQYGVENTLPAIEGAIDLKANYCEIDVLETKDGELVLSHDNNLKRLAGVNKNISDMTLEEVKQIDLYQDGFIGKIPTLQEAIDLCQNKIKLNIDVKFHGEESANYIDKIINTIKNSNFENQCIVQSTDYDAVQELKTKDPKLVVGYVLYAKISDLKLLKADFLNMEESLVNENTVALCRLLNKPIYVWTVNKKSNMEKFYLMGVDGVLTDEVKEFQETIEELKQDRIFYEQSNILREIV